MKKPKERKYTQEQVDAMNRQLMVENKAFRYFLDENKHLQRSELITFSCWLPSRDIVSRLSFKPPCVHITHRLIGWIVTATKKIDLIIKILAGQVKLTNAHTVQAHDHSLLIASCLPKCARCKVDPHTVTFEVLDLRFCDRCAAEWIVSSRTKPKNENSIEAKLVTSLISDADSWEDVENANSIRGLMDYLKQVEDQKKKRIVHL